MAARKGVAAGKMARVAGHELPEKNGLDRVTKSIQGQVRVQGGLIFILWATETRTLSLLWAVVKLRWSWVEGLSQVLSFLT